MGNRAVITTPDKKIGVYLHWNGGRDSVEGFLRTCKKYGFRPPERDNYGWARLCQVIANFFGPDGLSVGIGPYEELDRNNGDNGVYIIKDCPNEENAQKFVDWLTSKDVQEYMNNTQFRRTIRKDVPAGDAMAPMESINVITDDETYSAEHKTEWLDEFKDIFTS